MAAAFFNAPPIWRSYQLVTKHGQSTPTAFHHPAQRGGGGEYGMLADGRAGCEERATLGLADNVPNPERVDATGNWSHHGFNPFRVGRFFQKPRVGAPRSRQPWADRLNTFGVFPS